MSDTPINLNKIRKARAKVAQRQQAGENSVRFGRTKAEKAVEKAQGEQAVRHLDGHKRDE